MIPKNKLSLIVLICVLISFFGYDQTAYAQKTKPVKKVTSTAKTISAPKAKSGPKVKPTPKAKSAYKAATARKATPARKTIPVQHNWMVTGYGAMLTPDTLGDTLILNAAYEDSYVAVLAVARKIYTFKNIPLDLELEGQVGKHFGEQNHFEVNLTPVFRWKSFPWDKYLDTSFAAGAGLSYAFEKPDIEENSVGKDHSSPKLLGYLMFEFAFALPDHPQWSFVTRVHHRSGADGLFDGRLDASNGIGFGIKYTF